MTHPDDNIEAIEAIQCLAQYALDNGADEDAVDEDMKAAEKPIRRIQAVETMTNVEVCPGVSVFMTQEQMMTWAEWIRKPTVNTCEPLKGGEE